MGGANFFPLHGPIGGGYSIGGSYFQTCPWSSWSIKTNNMQYTIQFFCLKTKVSYLLFIEPFVLVPSIIAILSCYLIS